MVGSGLVTLLKVECDKIRDAPCEGCLRTIVEGMKPFVVRPGVEILTTCFPVRPLRSSYVSSRGNRAFTWVKREDYELSSRNLTLGELLNL